MTALEVASRLPDIAKLRDLCRSMAVLEAILSPDPESRYHAFGGGWRPGEEVASMSNGSGDEYSIVFSNAGAYIRGFAHDSVMSPYANEDREPWPGVLDSVPEIFQRYVRDPVFCDEDDVPVVTVCFWREVGGDRWHVGRVDYPQGTSDPDGSAYLFRLLTDPSAEAFQRFAEDYYATPVDLEVVRDVYELRPLTQNMISRLNGKVLIGHLSEDLTAVRYPTMP